MIRNVQTELVCDSNAAGLGHPTQFSTACDHRRFILQNKLGFRGILLGYRANIPYKEVIRPYTELFSCSKFSFFIFCKVGA